MTEPLLEKAALVTGASRGIGQAIAIKLAELGADVGLVQRGSGAETISSIEAAGRRGLTVRTDLREPAAAEAAVDQVAEEFGRLDVVVCNASLMHRVSLLEIDLERWQEVIDVNLTAAFVVSRAGARHFVAQGDGGRIIHIGSRLSFLGGTDVGAYPATKGALTRYVAGQP